MMTYWNATLKSIITVPNIKISLCVAPITTAIRLQRWLTLYQHYAVLIGCIQDSALYLQTLLTVSCTNILPGMFINYCRTTALAFKNKEIYKSTIYIFFALLSKFNTKCIYPRNQLAARRLGFSVFLCIYPKGEKYETEVLIYEWKKEAGDNNYHWQTKPEGSL